MSIDQRARRAAGALRHDIVTVDVPDVDTIAGRSRRRSRSRVALAGGVVAVLAVAGVALAAAGGDDGDVVEAIASTPGEPPAGSVTEGRWTSVPKDAAGFDDAAGFLTLTGSGDTLLLAGNDVSGAPATAEVWWSDDGFTWEETDHPEVTGSITAVAVDGEVALAVGSGGDGSLGQSTFVWRSEDGGRTWREVAAGSAVFGDPAPEMGRPFVGGLLRHDGWWVASGGGSAGYTGIWTSRDGARWEQVLDSEAAGSVAVVEGPGGALYAHGTRTAWTATDPTEWSEDVAASVPGTFYLGSVAPGAEVAVGGDFERHDTPTPLLRSDDAGRTWAMDGSFLEQFPGIRGLTIARAAGRLVVAGTSGTPNHPDAWVSSDAAGEGWEAMPESLHGSPAPERRIPDLAAGTVGLIGEVDGRVVIMSTAPELDRYYVFDPGDGATG